MLNLKISAYKENENVLKISANKENENILRIH